MALSTRTLTSRRDLPVIAASMAVVAWAIGPLMVRGFSVSTPTILFFRLLLAVPVMVAMAYRLGGGLNRQVLKVALLPGVLFALSIITSFSAYRSTAIVNATIIQSLSPALVLLSAGWLFGERRTRNQMRLAGLAFVGVAVVILGGPHGFGAIRSGDLYSVANLVVWTIYFLRMKHVRTTMAIDSWSLLAAIFVVSSVVVAPWAATVSNDLGAMTGNDWMLCVGLVVVPGLIGHGLMTWSQRDLDVTLSSLLSLASSPISTIGAWAIYHEDLHVGQVLGSAIVIGALGMIVLDRPAVTAVDEAVEPPV